MSKAPPTELDRLKLFCALVNEYDQIAAAFPAGANDFTVRSGPRPEAEHWHRVVRAMTLRKFVLTKTDEVYIGTVLTALEATMNSDVGRGLADRFRVAMSQPNWITYVTEDGDERQASELMNDLLYGGLLHGDYDKRVSVIAQDWATMESALWQFTSGAESLVRLVRDAIERIDADDGFDHAE